MNTDTADMQAHHRLVAALTRHLSVQEGDAMPQLMQTHISSVILAGAHAYKLKKPVHLSFLDFSTLAQRRHFCEEELRINRRTAAELYLDVLPVTGGVDEPRLAGDGAPVDWLLRMRRFAPEGVFKALAQAGQLQPSHVDALAAHLATFHMGLTPLPPGGVPAKSAWNWAADCFDDIAACPHLPVPCTRREVSMLRDELGALFNRQAALRGRRISGGWLRECHGDLHLDNIVLWNGRVMAFDAIEFDPALRCIDIINDLAFTFMDLHAYAQSGLGWRLVNAWVEQTGDFEGLALLHSYAAYRALVRAKVALLGDDAHAFLRYWPIARRFAQAPAAPRLVLTTGLSGSGKSTVALALAERMGAVRLRSDVERKRLHGMTPTQRPEDGSALYSSQATTLTYRRLADLTITLLHAGLSVVVDAAFLRQDERETMRQLAGDLGASFDVVHCVAPMATMQSRMVTRAQHSADASDATPDVLALQSRAQQAMPPEWDPFAHVLTNDGDLQNLDAQVQRLVGAWRAADL